MKMKDYKINNLPQYAKNTPYVVVRESENKLWFYGGFTNHDKARQAVEEISNGFVLINE